ncbi:TetR/AcrR family transcriptional regulator [Antrihabitans sp. YC2-6]|uniref:TetR/AcrR family transcriptional regulator n=1 Tax=Antrihabitans sp. YC2-6 TaxID=2799498 RepID=UPI0018F2DCDC|nr:TetR/AcrR family transcriptional regulator [Antrihabitans sp. YC2-6]MBJ8345081.1 TetR/AcrR family transcriptional regulator [Antrihabitans sp. YC2-6]
MPTVVRPFRGVSAEERLAQRREDLIEAAFDVAGAVGLRKLTMTAVCERADLTQRYFYEHFRNRDELVNALYDTVFDEFFGRARLAAEAQPEDDLLARARAAMAVFVEFCASDPRKARVFAEASGSAAITAHRADSTRRFTEYATQQAIAARRPPTAREFTRVQLAASIVIGGMSEACGHWLSGAIDLPRDEFIDELAQLFVVAVDAALNTH